MEAFTINTILLLVAFFLTKNKIIIFLVWLLTCFIPFFIFVREGEQRDLEMALSMGEDVNMLSWYFGITIASLFWTLIPFLKAFVIFYVLKLIAKFIRLRLNE